MGPAVIGIAVVLFGLAMMAAEVVIVIGYNVIADHLAARNR